MQRVKVYLLMKTKIIYQTNAYRTKDVEFIFALIFEIL